MIVHCKIAGHSPDSFQLVELGDDRLGVGLDLLLAAVAAEVERSAFGGHLERLAHRPQVVVAHRADGLRDRGGLFGCGSSLMAASSSAVSFTAPASGLRVSALRPFDLRGLVRLSSRPWRPAAAGFGGQPWRRPSGGSVRPSAAGPSAVVFLGRRSRRPARPRSSDRPGSTLRIDVHRKLSRRRVQFGSGSPRCSRRTSQDSQLDSNRGREPPRRRCTDALPSDGTSSRRCTSEPPSCGSPAARMPVRRVARPSSGTPL